MNCRRAAHYKQSMEQVLFQINYLVNSVLLSNFKASDSFLLGDVNLDGVVNLLDVGPFIDLLGNGTFQIEADCNQDGLVNLLDVKPFISILSGN